MRLTTLFALALLATPASAQERPLPDLGTFLRAARRHLETDDVRKDGYAYQETRHDLTLDGRDRVVREQVGVYDTYPGLPGEGSWKRLISENGRPTSVAQLEKADRERRSHVEAYARRMERESDRDRQARVRARERARHESDAFIDDALRLFDIRIVGREMIAAHETIVLALSPRATVKPHTAQGGLLELRGERLDQRVGT